MCLERRATMRMLRIITIALLMAFASLASAQDVITLRNGKTIDCHLLQFSGGQFKVRKIDGNVIVGNASAVQSIEFQAPEPEEEAEKAGGRADPEMQEKIKTKGSLGDVCRTPTQKAELVRFATRTFDRPIRFITLTTSWGHPRDVAVAVVHFKRLRLQGQYYEEARSLIYHRELPPKWPDKDKDGNVIWGPDEGDAVSGPWFTDRKMRRSCIVRYRLRDGRKLLRPPDTMMSYHDVRELLLSIEAKAFDIKEGDVTPGDVLYCV
jgi:hypothetical protein